MQTLGDEYREAEYQLDRLISTHKAELQFAVAEIALIGHQSACEMLIVRANDARFVKRACKVMAADHYLKKLKSDQRLPGNWPTSDIEFNVLSKLHHGGRCRSGLSLACELIEMMASEFQIARMKAFGPSPDETAIDSLQSIHVEFWNGIEKRLPYLSTWPLNEVHAWRDVVKRLILDERDRIVSGSDPRFAEREEIRRAYNLGKSTWPELAEKFRADRKQADALKEEIRRHAKEYELELVPKKPGRPSRKK